MHKLGFKFLILIVCLYATPVFSQSANVGTIGSMSVSADMGRKWSAKVEQELRFDNYSSRYNRSMTTVGVDFVLLRKMLKGGLDYDFIHLAKNDVYELRHRFSASLTARAKLQSFAVEWRTKAQALLRDNTRGNFVPNPKYVWRNMLEGSYSIYGSAFKPYVSAEIFCPLYTAYGTYLDAFRTSIGFKYRVSQHNSLDVRLRYDSEVQQKNPQSNIYAIVGWNYKL